MPKNQKNARTKKYRHDRNRAEFLDNIDFFSIIIKRSIKLVYEGLPLSARIQKPTAGPLTFCPAKYISPFTAYRVH